MDRRKFIAAMGSLAAGGAAATGTGAFTQVSADRTVTVDTESDAEGALLGLEPNDEDGVYADTTNGTLEVTFEDVNKNAVTTFENLVTIENNGTSSCDVYVNVDYGTDGEDPIYGSGKDNYGPLEIKDSNDESIVGGNTQQTGGGLLSLEPGDSENVTFVLDTHGEGSLDIDGEVLFKAV
jgi:hypothetical protein